MVNIQPLYPTIISFFEGLPFNFCMVLQGPGMAAKIQMQ
jgi:hypothetical protein